MSLTTAEVASVLGCPTATVRSHVRRGHLTQLRPGVFDEDEVNAFRARRWTAQARANRARAADAWTLVDDLLAAHGQRVQL